MQEANTDNASLGEASAADQSVVTEPSTGPTEDAELTRVIDISPEKNSRLLKRITKKGVGAATPSNGDKVNVHYVGRLADGTQFDSSRERNEQFVFNLGAREVIQGWDIGVKTMKRGEVAEFIIHPDLAYGANGHPPDIPPHASLVFEIELFDWQLEDITKRKDKGVRKRVLVDGEGWDTPNKGSSCQIEYTGKYCGTPFEERSVSFCVGEGSEEGVVEAIEIAVRKMKKGERCEIFASPAYVWGNGVGKPEAGIPNDYEEVTYEICLKSFENVKEAYEMDNDERIKQATLVKGKGTKYFKEGKYKLAVKQYKRVLQYLSNASDFESEEKTKAQEILLAGNLNLAMCQLKLQNYLEAQRYSDKALEIDAKNEKGLFRRGQAYFGQKEYELAVRDFAKLLQIDSNNQAAKSQFLQCQAKIKAHREKEKEKYKNMFEIFAKQDSEKEKKKDPVDGFKIQYDPNSPGDDEILMLSGDQPNKDEKKPTQKTAA